MPFLPPQQNDAGGILELEYSNASMCARHTFHIHVCPFDAVSLAYQSPANKVPAVETHLSDTYSALCPLLMAYYPDTWQITSTALYYNNGQGDYAKVNDGLGLAALVGTNVGAPAAGPTVRRTFHVKSRVGKRRRLYLRQLTGDAFENSVAVSGASGGFDTRDRALMAYLTSANSGVCASDGWGFQNAASVNGWHDRPLEPCVTGGTGGSGDAIETCETFTNGATICNPAVDVVDINTPGGTWTFSPTRLTMPTGHYIEVA